MVGVMAVTTTLTVDMMVVTAVHVIVQMVHIHVIHMVVTVMIV
jgi:hypothetical protein